VKLHRGFSRPLRWLILIASAGAVLAADNTWTTKLRFDFDEPLAWLSTFYAEGHKAPEPAIAEASTQPVSPGLGMDRLVNGLLYSAPSMGWTLDGARPTSIFSAKSQQSSGLTNSFTATAPLPPAMFSSDFVATSTWLTAPSPTAPDASGNWISNASGNWGTAANWQTSVIANGAGSSAHFDQLDITTDVTVNNEAPRTIGNVYVGDTNGTNHYTISGSTLTFDSNALFTASILQQSSTSAGDTISAPLILNSSLDVNNMSTTKEFHLSGNIAPAGSVSTTLWFNRASGATGNIRVTGNITDGTGGQIDIVVGGGTVRFEGTNTYTGSTSVDTGLLLVNGNNSAATGTVYVSSGGTLGGTGTVGGDVYTFGGTITGDTSTTVGSLTLLGDVHLRTGEGDGTYLANLSGNMSDLLVITGTLFLGGESALNIVGAADGTTTYTLATFGAHDGTFDPMLVTGIPTNYALVYHDTDLQLVPIPEPSTWIGGALAVAALAVLKRRRRTRLL
jgi:autotransporter-associated beta strand protein